jgi:acetyl-CoA/propionyl-CoA carboxylase, biotin carboxylase, biotin carboxyl carrier protein
VNARLQVEHPVTEMTTGLDLVRCQIEIAAGLPLALRPEDLLPRGHAIECRLYAEDPGSGFLPAPGRIERLREPCGPGIRFDGGVAAGSEVPAHYDPLLGKVVAHGPTRGAAIARMIRALEDCVIEGVPTPRDLLIDVLRSEPFQAGRTHTGLLEQLLQGWRPPERPQRARSAPPPPARPASPWHDLGAFDLVSGGEPARRGPRPAVPAPARRRAAAAPAARERAPAAGPGAVTPPMPASVVAVLVEVGQAVEKGQPAVVVSAMKMEIQLGAPCSGRVRAVSAAAGQNVRPGDVLVEIEIEQPGGPHGG